MKLLQSVKILPISYFPSQHLPDLNLEQPSLAVLLNVDVDWEMGVDVTHLVLEALGNANDHVVDQGLNCAESCDILAGTVVEFDVDNLLLWGREVDCKMAEVL